MTKIKDAIAAIRGYVSLTAGLLSFFLIMSAVGNAHVAETFLALAVAIVVSLAVFYNLPKKKG